MFLLAFGGTAFSNLSLNGQIEAPSSSPVSENHNQSKSIIFWHEYDPDAGAESPWNVEDPTVEFMQKGGANTPIEGLRQMPIFLGTTATENDSNGGNGAAFISLYGLGPNNVLTLINGRRALVFSDINAVPISALNSAEIVKHTGAAIYGSGAVGGIFNFILINGPGERPYQGAELYLLYGNTTDSDAHVRQVYLRGGVTGLDGKVSIAATGEYYSRANLYSRDREISHTADLSNNPTGLGLGGVNNNSPTYAGRISVGAGATALGFTTTGQLVLSDLTNNQVTPGSYRHFDTTLDPSEFNFRAFTPAIPAMEKAMYYVTGRYKIFDDSLQLYGDVMYSKVKQDNGLAGVPFSFTSPANGLSEARESPFNPAGNFLTSVRYRLQQELGNRSSLFDKDYWRYTVGINGDFAIKDNSFISRFGYDSGFVYTHLDEEKIDSGDVTRSQIRSAIDGTLVPGVFFNPFIGQNAPLIGNAATYIDGIPTGQTAPYNNLVTAQAASYIGRSFFNERDWLADAKAHAHLFPNLWNGGVDIAVGYEHREIQQHSLPDPVQVTGDQLGFSPLPNTKTLQEANAFFVELIFPIVTTTMNVKGIRSLETMLAWGYEKFDYSDRFTKQTGSFDNVNDDENFGGSPTLSLRYQPIAGLTLRVSWGQSIRPPIPANLFDPLVQDFPQFFFPSPGPPPPPLGFFRSGNLDIQAEKTDTYSAGLAWSPKLVPGLVITVDWYQLFTTDLILGGDQFAQLLLANNVIAPINDITGCGIPNNIGLVRDPIDGTLFCVNSPTGNAGKRLVQGFEMTADYEVPTERFGKITFTGGWNHFFTWKAQPGYGDSTSFLGNFDNQTLPLTPGAIPWNKAFLRFEWEWNHFDFVATGNYIGDFRDDKSFNGDQFGVGGPDYSCTNPDNPNQPFCPPGVAGLGDPNNGRLRTVASYTTLDMQLSYEFVKPMIEPAPIYDSKESKNVMQTSAETPSIWQRMLWGTKLTVGVNNAFDRSPPTVLGALNDNYDTSLYTLRNRFYYVSLDKKF